MTIVTSWPTGRGSLTSDTSDSGRRSVARPVGSPTVPGGECTLPRDESRNPCRPDEFGRNSCVKLERASHGGYALACGEAIAANVRTMLRHAEYSSFSATYREISEMATIPNKCPFESTIGTR